MVLSQPDIRKAVREGRIVFSPALEEEQWSEASVDLRLGFSFTVLRKDLASVRISVADGLKALASADFWRTRKLKPHDDLGKVETFTLEPNEFVLAMTYERVKIPLDLIARIEGRSTYARVGLTMHQTAPWIQPGWDGPIVLEIINHGPFKMDLTPLKDRPCQLAFFNLSTPLPENRAYGTRETIVYQRQTHPVRHDQS